MGDESPSEASGPCSRDERFLRLGRAAVPIFIHAQPLQRYDLYQFARCPVGVRSDISWLVDQILPIAGREPDLGSCDPMMIIPSQGLNAERFIGFRPHHFLFG